MSHGKTDKKKIGGKRNTARFFVQKRHVSWVLLIGTCLWGVYGYLHMPHRKDPEIQVRTAVSVVPWPGASAEKIEQLVTKKVEEKIAANAKVTKIESISRTGVAVIYFELDESLKETGKEFDDIKLKLDAINDLPNGAGPINFIKDLLLGGVLMSQLKTQFFPKDLSYLSYVDIWLPNDAPLSATNDAAAHSEAIIREVVAEYGKGHPDDDGQPRNVLQSLTTFVGGSGPAFWFSVVPELQQSNYAQIIVQVKDKHDTEQLIRPLQEALSARVAGARIDVRQLESGKAVGMPVAIRVSGQDVQTLHSYASRVKAILEETEIAERVRDDWGDQSFAVHLKTDPDRANIAGVTNHDVAMASLSATHGKQVTTLREGDKQIPVVARLRMEERAQLGALKNLYVYGDRSRQKVLLRQVASTEYGMQIEKMRSRNQFRTITVSAMPADGKLASEVMSAARPKLNELQQTLPAGYRMEVGGEEEEQVKGFFDLTIVLAISVAAIFLALVCQFKNAIKPFIVFAAVPFGMVGALAALWIMGAPFGFMAFGGIVSLVGVIVSRIIVLFDFIEEKHREGEPLIEALLDAGIMRLRPVLITVGATVIALFPLASHGGPLWEPLCYAQIGGLSVATFITLLLVPVIYSIFVLDLKVVKWEREETAQTLTDEAPAVVSQASAVRTKISDIERSLARAQ